MKWKPKQTWVIYASLVEGHFDPAGRRDQELVDALVEAGVPDEQITFLADQEATAENVLAAISAVGEQAEEQDLLLFIFSGHGTLHRRDEDGWTNRYMVEGDDVLTSQAVIDAIEESFGGHLAVIIADNCMSGATVDDVEAHEGEVSIAALSSTASFDVSWTGWLLITQLIWLVEGQPWLDANGDGAITLEDFFTFVEEEMALVRGFKPSWYLPEDLEDLTFHKNLPEKAHEREHERVHAANEGKRAYGRILTVDEENETAEVQWLDRFGVATSEVSLVDCVALTFEEHEVGTVVLLVEAGSQAGKKGARGTVEETFLGLHLVRFDDGDEDDPASLYDWVGYKRLAVEE